MICSLPFLADSIQNRLLIQRFFRPDSIRRGCLSIICLRGKLVTHFVPARSLGPLPTSLYFLFTSEPSTTRCSYFANTCHIRLSERWLCRPPWWPTVVYHMQWPVNMSTFIHTKNFEIRAVRAISSKNESNRTMSFRRGSTPIVSP